MISIEHTISTSATPATAYAAVATPEGIRAWWCKDSDVGVAPGAEHELRFMKDGNPVVMKFRLDAVDPDREVRWTCTGNANPAWVGTTLAWTIEGSEGGTRVRFAHAGFAEDGPAVDMTRQGWAHFEKSLTEYLDGGAGQPW